MIRKSNSALFAPSSVVHVIIHLSSALDRSTLVTLHPNDSIPRSRKRSLYAAKYSPTCVATGNEGVSFGHAKSEKQEVCLERFVRIDGRHRFASVDHNPPTDLCDSKTRGERPASKAAFADARPDGPAFLHASSSRINRLGDYGQ